MGRLRSLGNKGIFVEDPAVRETGHHINQKPGLGIVFANFAPIHDYVASTVESRVELNEDVQDKSDVNYCLKVEESTLSLNFEAESVRDQKCLVDDKQQPCNVPDGDVLAIRVKENGVLTLFTMLGYQLDGLIVELLFVRAHNGSLPLRFHQQTTAPFPSASLSSYTCALDRMS